MDLEAKNTRIFGE